MQLCIVHALENIKGKLPGESEDELSKRLVIHSTITKVSKVARTLRSSTTASEFLRQKNVYVLTKKPDVMEFVSENALVICKGRQKCIECGHWRIVKV